jgi:hypothetical protein
MDKGEGAPFMEEHARRWAGRRRLEQNGHEHGAARPPRRRLAPTLELLEGRRLLSTYTGPSAMRAVSTSGGIFLIQVSGPGLIKVHSGGRGAIDLNAFGTTSGSTITVTLVRPHYHARTQLLDIHNLTVTSGQLGGLDASPVILTGTMTPLENSVNTLDLGVLGPAAQVNINGSVGTMSVQMVNLGPTGRVTISGALNTANSPVSGTGGSADLTGLMAIGSLTINGGQFDVGQDSLTPISIAGDMTISHDGRFSVGRDLDGSLSVNGNLVLDTGGQLFVGRNLSELFVNGSVIVNPTESGIVVGGALSNLIVNGYVQGQGGTSAPTVFDVGVGLSLSGLTINGGNNMQNGLINSNIRAGASITGVSIAYGTANSTIQPNTPPPV